MEHARQAGPSSGRPSKATPFLPLGWTQHTSPSGRPYYYNSSTGKSTYKHPSSYSATESKIKREKPVSKTPLLGTNGWLLVATNRGNVFYFQPETKRSEWTAPEEIRDAVRAHNLRQEKQESQESEQQERKRKAAQASLDDADSKRVKVTEGESDSTRVKGDTHVEEAEEEEEGDDEDMEWQRQIAEQMAAEAEAAEIQQAQPPEADQADSTASAPPAENAEPEKSVEQLKLDFFALLTSLNGRPQEINPMAPWDLEFSKFSDHASFKALSGKLEAEDLFNEWCKIRLREKRALKLAAAAASESKAATSSKQKLSPEEAFKSLLKEEVRSTRTKFEDFKAVFRRDPRFSLFGRDDRDREKMFKAWLVELGEEKRKAAEKAESEFLDLLGDKLPGNYRNKVSEEAKKLHNNGQGQESEREREAISNVWSIAKKTPGLVQDKRYDALGSSTRRLELFGVWCKGERRQKNGTVLPHQAPSAPIPRRAEQPHDSAAAAAVVDKARLKEEANRRALKEREERVRREREKISRLNRAALGSAMKEESKIEFQQLLVDSIRDAHMAWEDAIERLNRDPRFDAPGLLESDQRQLFSEHIENLAQGQSSRLANIFERHAKHLDVHPEDAIALTLHDQDLGKGSLRYFQEHPDALKSEFEKWNEQRYATAKEAFFTMLRESAFVEFWGRLKNSITSNADDRDQEQDGIKPYTTATDTIRKDNAHNDDDDEDEEQDQATLLDMAKKVDLEEITSILRNDARFRAFKHIPEQREDWIRQHLAQLAGPKKSFIR